MNTATVVYCIKKKKKLALELITAWVLYIVFFKPENLQKIQILKKNALSCYFPELEAC